MPGVTASPRPVLNTSTPTFQWHAVAGVPFTGYQLTAADLTANTTATYTVGPGVASVTPATPLAAGHKFVWNVRVANGTRSGPTITYL